MTENLTSTLWTDAKEQIRACHLSQLAPETADLATWKKAFDTLMDAIAGERKSAADFSAELSDLTEASGFDYSFSDILEEYFDHLEEKAAWEMVVESCDRILAMFAWKTMPNSEYMFRKGNALEKLGKIAEAEAFGRKWLEEAPEDYYAAASLVFLLITEGKIEEAEEITGQYLRSDLVCDSKTDTFFMAAYRLYELTDNAYAKQRVEQKIAEYNAIAGIVEQ